MNYQEESEYMSMIEVTHDKENPLLSRREITCRFKGLAGRLKKIEAVEMITKQLSLNGKFVVPINLKNDTGKPIVSGTFYVYDDEALAKEHLNNAIFKRIEKAKAKPEEKEAESPPQPEEKAEDEPKEEKKTEEKTEEKKTEDKEVKNKPEEKKDEEKKEEGSS